MHTKDQISDFKKGASTVINAAIACQEATMPLVPYFPPFLSTYAASTHIPSSLNIRNDDNKSDQGYSDDKQPMLPELYKLDEPSTPITENQPSHLIAYDTYPGKGWGQMSIWPSILITLLLEITPNPDPWPYLPEQYHSSIPTGALSYSLESSPAFLQVLLPSPPHTDTPPPPVHPSTDLPLLLVQ
jgi:hypothetical protein